MTEQFDQNPDAAPTVPMGPAEGNTLAVGEALPAAASDPAAVPGEITPSAGTVTSDHVSVPKRALVIGGSALVALFVAAGVFAAGVAVGHRTGGFDPRGGDRMQMTAPPNSGYAPQADGRGWGGREGERGDDSADGYGRGRGRMGLPPGMQQDQGTTPAR